MAEALGAIGTAASFIQLADASIRTCFCLYAFFSSLHNAQPEFQRHIIVIRDVHDAVQLVRKTANSHGLTEAEKTVLSGQLNSVIHELSTLEKATAGKDPTKLRVKLIWVKKMAETDRVLQRLENHKTSLMLLLQALQLGQSGQILQSQASNQNHLRDLQTLVEQQSRDHITMRSDLESGLAGMGAKIDSHLELYKESLEEGFSTLKRDNGAMVSEEHLGNVLRHALDSHILSRVEESLFARSESQNAATLRQFRTLMTDATNQILQHVDKSNSTNKSPRGLARPGGKDPTTFSLASPSAGFEELRLSSPEDVRVITTSTQNSHDPFACHSRRVTDWSYWARIPHVGTVRVEYRIHVTPSGRFYTFKINFWPTIFFFDRKCISLKYSNRRDGQGYMALCPSLAIYPVLPDDDIIWSMVADDDLDGVIARFQQQKNGPFDQDCQGLSLLIDALGQGSHRVAQFLLQQGADPTQTTARGRDGLNALVWNELYSAVVGPQVNCPCCHKHTRPDFSLFFTTFHSLLAAGCDLEDCQVSIFQFIMNDRLFHSSWHDDDHDYDLIRFSSYERALKEYMSGCYSEKSEDNRTGKVNDETVTGSFPINHGQSTEVESFDEDPDGPYLGAISQLAQFLDLQGLDLLQENPESLGVDLVLLQPHRVTLSVLQTCGLTSNYEGTFCDNMRPVIYEALYSILLWEEYVSTYRVLIDNLVTLVCNGANIYHIELASSCWIDDVEDDGLMSPTVYVKANNLMSYWRYALKAAGYDPEQVLLEDERRRRKFRQLQGASSSSVEVAEENPESSIRRRGI